MGLQVGFESLSFLCTLPEEMTSGDMIDREFINIYTLEVSEEDLNSIDVRLINGHSELIINKL